jgi:Flp pilus assembly protein CpaB
VTAEQAQTLFQAQEVGTLRLSLRPFGDDEVRPVTPIFNELPEISGR